MELIATPMLRPPFLAEFREEYAWKGSHDDEMGRNIRDISWRAQIRLECAEGFFIHPPVTYVRDAITFLK
jgi:hypothetical protein